MAHVPEGYELLDGPAVDLAETSPNLETHSETNDNVGLTVWPTLMLSGPTWQTVQIGSERGYLIEPHTGVGGYEQASLAWPTPNGSWATLYGCGAIARQLPQIASQVTWVDRNTWVNTYDASSTEPFPGETSADAPTSSSNDGTTEPTTQPSTGQTATRRRWRSDQCDRHQSGGWHDQNRTIDHPRTRIPNPRTTTVPSHRLVGMGSEQARIAKSSDGCGPTGLLADVGSPSAQDRVAMLSGDGGTLDDGGQQRRAIRG